MKSIFYPCMYFPIEGISQTISEELPDEYLMLFSCFHQYPLKTVKWKASVHIATFKVTHAVVLNSEYIDQRSGPKVC